MTEYSIETPKQGSLTEIKDDIYWARFALPFRLDHINLYVLDKGDSWLVLDTGIGTIETAEAWTALLDGPLSEKPISTILTSHHHVDHIGYSGSLARRTGAESYISKGEFEIAEWLKTMEAEDFATRLAARYKSFGLDMESIKIGYDDKDRYRKNVTDLPSFKFLESGATINSKSGNWQVRIDSGHSPAQISLHDKARQIYIAVDFLLPRISPNVSSSMHQPTRDELGAYLTYLEDIQTEIVPTTLILPGHDWPFTDGASRASELIAHHEHRLNLLLTRAIDAPLTVRDGMEILFERRFDAHELFFASGESSAHLNHLVAKGKLEIESQDGILYYHRTKE